MSLGNFETGEVLDAQYNPLEVEISIEAVFNRVKAPGQTGEELQYSNTSNVKPSFTLKFNARAPNPPNLLDVEAFLYSLMFPRAPVSGVTNGAPPRVVLSWPNWILLVTRMPSFKQRTTMWGRNGAPEVQEYKVELETSMTRRIGHDEIRRSALRRSP